MDNLKSVGEMSDEELRNELASVEGGAGDEPTPPENNAGSDVSQMSDEELEKELAALEGGKRTPAPQADTTPAPREDAPIKEKRIIARNVPLADKDELRQTGGFSTGEYVANKLAQEGLNPIEVGSDDGRLVGMGKTLGNLFVSAGARPLTNLHSMRQQQLMRGFVDAPNGGQKRVADMSDEEQDYMADEAGINGWSGAARNILGFLFSAAPKLTEANRIINGDFTPVVSRSLASITGKTSNEEAIDAAASVVGKKVSRWAVPNGSPDDNPLAMWDATEGANEPNDLIRREKRAAYLQQLAQGMVTMTEQDKENARREAAARNPTDDVDILGETVIQGGYSIPFMVDPTHFALPAAMSATSRYGKMKSDAYRFDESGNLTVASRRETDDAVAAAKAGIGGVAEAGIERVGGEVVSKVGGSLLKHTIGKLPVFEKVGEKITTSAVGKAMAGFARKFRVLANYTGVNQFHEEIAEEFEQDIIDRGLGIDLHPDEMDGNAASRSLDVTKDFFKPSNLWKLSQSMIGMMVFQGGAAYAYDRLGSRRIDAVLEKGLGVDAKELGNYTQAEKKAAFSAWVNSWDEQKVSEMFGDTTKYVTELTKLISQHSGDFDFGSVRQGKDGKFKLPTRTVAGADGKTTAQEVWRNEADGEGRPCRVMTDNESGVTIREYDDGSGNKTYRIGDTIGSHRTAGDLNQALAQADTLVAENNVRKAKVQFLQGVAKRMYGGADVFYADNLRDAVRGLTNEYGVDEVRKLMGTDEFKAGKDAGQSFHFTDENGKDVIVFMLNRIRNADEALTAATHEGGAHSGLTKAVADKRAFLQNIDMKSLFRADRVKFMEVLRDQAIQRGYLAEADKEDSAKVEAALRQTMQDADAAEEVFAYLTEDNGANFSPKMKDMVVAAARDLHRKMFKSDLKYNASDIYAIAARGRKALAKGSGGKATVVGRKETETAAPAPSGKPAPAASGASAPTGGKSAPVSAPTATPTAPTAENGAEVDDFGDEYAAFADSPTDTHPTTAHKGPTTAPSAGGTTSRPTSTKPVEGVKSTDSGTHTAEGGAEGETTTTTTTESVSVSADTSAKDAKAKTHNFNRAKKRFMDALAKYARAYNRGRHKGEYDVAVKELDAAIAELFASPTSAWKFKVTLPDGTQTTFNLDARIKPHPQTGVRQLDEYQVRSLVSRICPAIKDKSAQIVAKRLCDRLNPMVASHVAAIFASKSHQGNLTERQRIAEENFRGKKRIKNWCDAHPESLLARWFNWFGAANPKMFAEAFSQSSVTDADLFAGAEDAYAKKGWDTALEEWANGVGGFAQMGDGSFDFSGCYETLMKQYEEAFAETRTPEQIAEDDEREHEEWLAEQEARERDAENEAYDFIGSAEARDAYDRIVAESKLTDDHGDPVGSIRDIPDGAFFTVNGEEFQMLGRAEDGSVVVEKFIEFDDIRQYTITPTESGVDVKEVDYDYETRWIDGAGRADVRGGENREADGRAEAEARRGEVAGREAEGQAAAEADAATGDAVGGASRGAASVAEAFGGEGVKWRKATSEESNRLDGVPTRKVYRGMQLVDGKLYSPMAGKINGKWTDPQPVGEWIVADEHPELRLKNGKFTLNQGNKNISSVDAAYNPYWHTSRSPLNDQFSGAYLRPELVTVECEIPMTDEVDGKPYYAEGAKDAVGEHRWPQGPVSRQIVKQGGAPRTVFLSRYCKITRIVPDAEVAKVIMEKVGDKDVTFPINTVSPNLRTELSKLGAKFGDPEGNASQKSRAMKELEAQGVNWRKSSFRPSWRISRLYTGSAADYEKPSLVKVGTGEGSQAYGWGLYASSERGVAEGYAKIGQLQDEIPVIAEGAFRDIKGITQQDAEVIADAFSYVRDAPKGDVVDNLIGRVKNFYGEDVANKIRLRKDQFRKAIDSIAHENLYEQTFFTNRAPGDESHLLKWYEPVSEENWNRILDQGEKEKGDDFLFMLDEQRTNGENASDIYNGLVRIFGSPQAASEFLARADIDGIKYPVDSYGGKTVKDGDKAGWNYVSFRDDTITVDHKWVDGELQFRQPRSRVTPAEDAAYMDAVKAGDTATAARMVREAAAKAMPNAVVAYKGKSTDTTAYDGDVYLSSSKDVAKSYVGRYSEDGSGSLMTAYVDFKNPLVIDAKESTFDEVPTPKELIEKYGKGARLKTERLSDAILYDDSMSLEDISYFAKDAGYDGIVVNNIIDSNGWNELRNPPVATDYVAFGSSQIKSADPVTRDDNGEVIPLSQRFSESPDIRFRKSSFKANPTAADLSDALGMSIEEATALGFAASRIFDDAKETRMNSSAYTKNAVELALVRNKGRLFTRSGLKATADRIREWMQDYNIKLRRMEEALGVTKDKSAYYAADRAYGRIADMATEFQKECIEKLAEELSKAGISSPERYADFGLYLLAKHGAEYNRMIAQRSRYVADAVADPTAQPIVSAVLAGTRDLDDAAVADIKTALNWSDAEAEQFAKDLRGSSQSSKFWAEKLRDFDTAGDTARFAGAEAVIRDMTKRLRELLVSSGRLSRAQADTWESLSPNYVPMMHEEESEFDLWSKFFWGANEKPTGRFTKSYTDSETKHGFGRTTMPENPIPFVIQQYQSAIQRAADNEVRRALADMVRAQEAVYANDNTKPRIGKVFRYMSETERKDAQKQIGILSALPTRTAAQDAELARLQTAIAESNNTGSAIPVTKVVGQNGLVYEVPKVSAIENENPDIIAFKEDGDLKFVKLGLASGANAQTLVENNGWLATSDAQDIGRAIKKQSLVSHAVFENLRKVTGLYSALRTAWSPTFLISNFLADNSQASRNLYSTFGAAGVAKFEHFAFGRNSLGAARAVLNRKYGTSLIQQYAKEWAENGGRIGGMATETAEKIQNDFARQLRMAAPHLAGLAKINTPEDAWNYVSDKWYGIRDLVETGNSIVEMSTRIASYATFREMTKGNGKTDAENIADAVSYSRDVTVNFNRKGRLTPIVNALYAFSNASIQDIQRSLEAFGEKRYGAAAANMGFFAARTGMKMGVGLMLLGFLNAWLGFGQDDPDKEKQGDPQWKNQKEYVKQNKIVFRIGDKTFSIPVRGLSRIPYYLGHNLYEVCVNGNKSAWQAAKDITDLAVNNLTDVIGSAPTKLQAFMPSAVRPGVEIAENKTFSGSQMYREPFKGWGTKWNLGRMNTPTVYHRLAYYMNWLGTGGHPERTSALDVQPEKLQAYWQWLTGSLGRDVQQLFGNAADMAQGRMPDLRNAFGASRFLGKVDENSARYHEAAANLEAARDELKKIDPDDTERLTEFFQEHPYLHRKNRRWDEVLKGLASDSTQMLKMEMRETDEDAKKETHKTRLLAQQLFMEALEANPKKYDADAKQDFNGREKLVTRFVKQSKRDDKREQKRNEREMRKSQRNIPFMP